MNEDWRIKIEDVGYKTSLNIYIFRKVDMGIELLGSDQIFKHGDVPSNPTLELSPDQLQTFADALNDKGFKPKQGYQEGKLEATEKHLKDMRTLLKLK